MKTKQEKNHAKDQAAAQLASIKEMVKALKKEQDTDETTAREAIENNPLSVEVRSDWHQPGGDKSDKPTEFKILLCWGGPAVRIVGYLDEHCQPEDAKLQYQDWGTGWTDYALDREGLDAVLEYSRVFWFGE